MKTEYINTIKKNIITRTNTFTGKSVQVKITSKKINNEGFITFEGFYSLIDNQAKWTERAIFGCMSHADAKEGARIEAIYFLQQQSI